MWALSIDMDPNGLLALKTLGFNVGSIYVKGCQGSS